jgi:hypothetical protein
MTRILLRAPKDPFEVVDAERTLERNLIATNSGNLVFIGAAHKILSAPGVEIEPDRLRTRPRDAAFINERYDAYVIPLANAFRPSFEAALIQLTGLIERLRIPVVVLGVGAQATIDYDWSRLAPMAGSVKAFVGAVLDHGPTIGVRGELTGDYLRSLGFRDVEVVGCPSMFLWGDHMDVRKRSATLTTDARLAITVSPYRKVMGQIVVSHHARYPNLTYVAQDLPSLELLVWGESVQSAAREDPLPVHVSHPLYREDKVRFYLDPWPWIDDLREQDFSFGTRIHGTIATLLAGTPAVLLAHDSRTLELARHFGIPHRRLSEVTPDLDAAELYAEADFTGLNAGHPARFAAFMDYLGRHGLDPAFAHPGAAEDWDARIAAAAFPPAVRAAQAGSPRPSAASRLRYLRYRTVQAAKTPMVRRVRGRLIALTTRRGRHHGDRAAGDAPEGAD